MGTNLTKELRSSDGNENDDDRKASNELLKFRSPDNNSYVPDISQFQDGEMMIGEDPNTNAYDSIDYALEESANENNSFFQDSIRGTHQSQ